jgi:hypothetical protein
MLPYSEFYAVETNPADREKIRMKLMKDAYAQLNQNLENERVRQSLLTSIYGILSALFKQIATDATTLIKHYKALMLA